jgi:hypothetical protein
MSNSTHEHGIAQPILDAISSWVKQYRQAVGLRGELANFREEEIAFVASDMGLTAEELLFAVSKGPHAADELPKLLGALGVDPEKLASGDPAKMRDLQLHHVRPQRSVPARSRRGHSP